MSSFCNNETITAGNLDISENLTNENPRAATTSTQWAVMLSLTLGAFILFAVIGNILVILSVACHRHLRIVTNYFIINLAVADLLLSTTVLPFSAVLGYWVFGRVFCNIWAAVDVLSCTASILSLCVISIDRYIGVSYPLRYPTMMNKKRGLITLAAVWVLAMVISIGPLLGWKEPDPQDDSVCKITEEPGYAIFSALGSFYVPLMVILAMCFRVYLAARGRSHSEDPQKISTGESSLSKHVQPSKSNSLRSSFSFRIHKFSKEKKAAKTLGIVVGVFVLCWLPFFVALPLGKYIICFKKGINRIN
ncbi:alpha-1A adrenergic receptor-like [Huso huso]|uniref:Alpha-1A adrenergic receptor-like n=1 Tax=Huso huso TaxID=61971 RepID=A0ABR0ZBP3_HUSHU